MRRPPHRFARRRDESAPILLPGFLVAMLTVVGAVVVVGRTGSDLADIVAVALLLIAAGLIMVAIARHLSEPNDAEEGP